MRKFLVSAALVAAVTTGSTVDLAGGICKDMERTATVVMEARQGGLEMSKSMEWAGGKTGVQEMVKSAYKYPQVAGPGLRQQIATEFGSKWYAWCLNRWGNDATGAAKPATQE